MSGIQLREVFGFGYTVGIQREEDACFLFSQVQSFKNGITYLFRSECADMESEGDYRFKVVNLHTAIIGSRMLRLIPYSLKTPLLQRAFSPARNVGAVTPNRSQSSHSLMAVAPISVGKVMLPLPSVVMMLRFMAMLGYGVTLPNDAFSLLPNIDRSLSSFCVVIFA